MKNLYQNFNFQNLYSPDFKEDSVREILILPILQSLGYDYTQIIRSKTLQHPFLKIGSKKRPVNLIPDYLLKIGENYAWVLDAKAPNENIMDGENVEQVYSYAIHPEVRTKFFALCNGREFALFRQDETHALLFFQLADIANYWEKLETYLSPDSFQVGKTEIYTPKKTLQGFQNLVRSENSNWYLSRPLLAELPVKKQAAKRHFGVHGYFTKQTWNVVQEYIRNFSQAGDVVLDPFGGSGVTAVEALMIDRKAIHIDLNPMSVFMVDSLTAPVKVENLKAVFQKIKEDFEENIKNLTVLQELLDLGISYPKNIKLPKGSDVESIEQLFSEKQIIELAFLKHLILKNTELKSLKKVENIKKIDKTEAQNLQKSLLLAFSSSITKINLTYHNSSSRDENAGNSSIFAYYRYRVSQEKIELDLIKTFETKIKKVINAKKEIELKINSESIKNAQIIKGTATDLKNLNPKGFQNPWGLDKGIANESIDYIYTDPPYGKKIPYLDLSTMWNAWLDLEVTEQDFELEAIEGGEHHKTKDSYNELISKSIQEMYRVLKFDRWLSFVFAHKDPEFWHLIVETAEKCGFEYAGAVKQGNGQTSFKKRQNPFTVLSGQLIINFRKVRKPKAIMKAALGMNIAEIMIQTCEGVIAANNGASLEQINDELIIKGLELGFLDLLKKEYSDLTPFLLDTFDYDPKTELFTIKKNAKFKTHIDLNLRVRYYLISFLRRMELEKKQPSFDEIVWQIMPLLKNGITPENQTILNVLEDIAEKVGENAWRLKKTGQGEIFG